MSATGPRLVGRLIKWLLVPLLLAAAGVFAIGPYLNKVGMPLPESIKPKQPESTVVQTEVTDDERGTTKFGEPTVEVTVGPGKTHLRKRSRRLGSTSSHHRRHRRKSTTAPAPAPTDGTQPPPPDTAPPSPPDGATSG